MTKTLKIILLVVVGLLLGIVLFFYFSFAGFPWTKIVIGQKTIAYLEEKYEEKFVIEDRFYNFKDGHYGIMVHPEKNPNINFIAGEGWGSHEFIDYYPEAVWTKQVKADFVDIIKETFPDHRRYNASSVYGEGVELVQGPSIPHYTESNAFVDVQVNMPYKFKESEEVFQKMLTLIEFTKNKGGNIHLFIVYEPTETDGKDTFYISFTNEEIKKIQTIEDVKKYYSIHNE